MADATPKPSNEERARALWLRTEDVVKHRILLTAILRLIGIAMALYYGYSAIAMAYFVLQQQQSFGLSMVYWVVQPTLMAITGGILMWAARGIAYRFVPTRITKLRCPDCDYELTELKDGRCTECGYLLSPLRADPATPLERALTIRAIFTTIYRLIGLALAAWALIDLAWMTLGAAYAMESIQDWFAREEAGIDTFILYRALIAAVGFVAVFLAPWLSRRTVPSMVRVAGREPTDP